MATQKGRNWSSGDIVTAANLSSIEKGVSAVAEEYTPTTWANGNTVTAAGLNNIEQGIVNAGSGSSDFSTATVTLICNASAVSAFMAIARDAELPFIPTPQSDGDLYMESGDELTVTAILYKGVSHCYFDGASSVVGTGDVEVVRDVEANITGDCTITISSGGSLPK